MRILYAEDERSLSEAIVDILIYHNYTVDAVYDGDTALVYAQLEEYDGIILDIMMPKKNGLEVMKEIQRTGDIFFPRNWAGALLRHHRSPEAYEEIQRFFNEHSDYPILLKNKILQAAWPLYREAANSLDM